MTTQHELAKLERDLSALRELKSHPGWQLLAGVIEKEVVAAAMQFADNPLMSEKEIDFRRGAIYATRNLLTAVDALIQRAENDVLLASATNMQAQFPTHATA